VPVEEEGDGTGGATGVNAYCSGNVGGARTAYEGEHKVAAGSHDLGTGPGAGLGAVLIAGDIADVVALVLNAPVATQRTE